MASYAIGVDLGTTNCALAWIPLHAAATGGTAASQVFPIPQWVDVGEVGTRPLLPSFVYLPGQGEFAESSRRLPWQAADGPIVGAAARKLGAKVPGRLVSSAKSWLCHAGVDRSAKILPWQTGVEVEKISPVEASALFLTHLREAWNAGPGSVSEADRLERQRVVLTIPASFDEVARELTVEAAGRAGLEEVTLLEEPQAAFYHWLESSESQPPLPVGSVVVVVDCGGGTTDFSLLAVREKSGRSTYERIAVGEHLLLGGDNIDVALARHVEEAVSPNRRLDLGQWWSLVLDARRIKEEMLGEDPPSERPVAVLGRGRRVVGDAARYTLRLEEVRRIVLEGFFPRTGLDEAPSRSGRMGLAEFGLPFASDPAITRHLAHFLLRHRDSAREASGTGDDRPAAVLFNGGVFNARACRDRVLETMAGWYGPEWQPRVLEVASLDLAVARGAARYAHLRAVGGERIKSGAARSYYVGLESEGAGLREARDVLCIVPQGLEEGERVSIEAPGLELQLGEPVAFPLFTSTVRPHDAAGEVLAVRPGQLEELPALTSILRGGKRAGRKRIAVRLEAQLTEIGVLELYCAARDGHNRWRLQFQTRANPSLEAEDGAASSPNAVVETWSEEQLSQARDALRSAFHCAQGKADPRRAVQLPSRLESALGAPRAEWPTSMLRALWETLLESADGRKLSPEHESRWYNFSGYFLRPGCGDPLDPYRVELLWKTIHGGVVHSKADRAWIEYWILCRRVAGGLGPSRQAEVGKKLLTYLPVGGARRSPRRVGGHEEAEIWRAAASLEHLAEETKIALGRRLLQELRSPAVESFVFWSLARIGTRSPFYGPANVVVPTGEVESWIEALLGVVGLEQSRRLDLDFALAQLARMTGDRARDVDPDLRARVLERLGNDEAPTHWRRIVEEAQLLDVSEQGRLLGDTLPPGLRVRIDAGRGG
jgi:hypothetical protein